MDTNQFNKIFRYQDGMNKYNINFRTVIAPPIKFDVNLKKHCKHDIMAYIDAHIDSVKTPEFFNFTIEQHCFYNLVKDTCRENHFKALIRTEFPNDYMLSESSSESSSESNTTSDLISLAIRNLYGMFWSQPENLEIKYREIELNRIYKILYCSDFFDDNDIDNFMTI
jgi:hypothetical protein